MYPCIYFSKYDKADISWPIYAAMKHESSHTEGRPLRL